MLQGLAAYKLVHDHPHILGLYASHEDLESIYLLVTPCEGGSVFSTNSPVRSSLDPVTAAKYTSQVASALEYCYSNGMLPNALLTHAIAHRSFCSSQVPLCLLRVYVYNTPIFAAGVVHRNISGDTIWLTTSTDQADAMLAGFEFSQICLPHQRLSARLGKVQYMAPEVFKQGYSFAADSHA